MNGTKKDGIVFIISGLILYPLIPIILLTVFKLWEYYSFIMGLRVVIPVSIGLLGLYMVIFAPCWLDDLCQKRKIEEKKERLTRKKKLGQERRKVAMGRRLNRSVIRHLDDVGNYYWGAFLGSFYRKYYIVAGDTHWKLHGKEEFGVNDENSPSFEVKLKERHGFYFFEVTGPKSSEETYDTSAVELESVLKNVLNEESNKGSSIKVGKAF